VTQWRVDEVGGDARGRPAARQPLMKRSKSAPQNAWASSEPRPRPTPFNQPLPSLADSAEAQGSKTAYWYKVVSVREAARNALTGEWDVPEFQRSFVYKASHVCELADSLWREYPVGMLLLWSRNENGAGQPRLWVVDGQQRLTSLCFLFGKTPSWWRDGRWSGGRREPYDIRFDVEAKAAPFFFIPTPERAGDQRLIPLRKLLDAGQEGEGSQLADLACALKSAGYCAGEELPELCARLARVKAMADRPVAAAVVTQQELSEVLEIFIRQGARGIRFRGLLLRILLRSLPGFRRWS
jgi:hypothetical protein